MQQKIIRIYLTEKFQTIVLPKSSTLLDLGIKDHKIVLWFLVNAELNCPIELRQFVVIKTDQLLSDYVGKYIGTVQMSDSPYQSESHIFEEKI